MDRRAGFVVAWVAIAGLVPGCKSMGGALSGLGKVAGGVAQSVAHVAPAVVKGVATVGGAVARTAAQAAPSVVTAVQVTAQAAATVPEFEWEIPTQPVQIRASNDPCEICPLDVECGVCAGYAGYACVTSPAGALARCESSAPPDAEPAPPQPAGDPAVGMAPDPSGDPSAPVFVAPPGAPSGGPAIPPLGAPTAWD